MVSRLAHHLSEARHRRFVGRAAERALFEAALTAVEPPFPILYIFGPGGVGKTTLLGELAQSCEQAGVSCALLDGRNVEPSPDAFLNALQIALDLPPFDSPLDALAARSGRQVLLLDTYETLAPLDSWMREVFLPQLPAHTVVVLAGRQPPSPAWRADPGWQSLVRTLPLRNLSPQESRDFLTQREVPAEQHQEVLGFTYGHPLALSLVADVFAQRGDFHFQPDAAPDVVKTLLERLVQELPGPDHRAALEACALVRLTREDLLSAMLGIPDTREIFAWLRGLSFVESGRQGVFPHDLAREALAADLRWRNPDQYAELHRRARTFYNAHLDGASGQEQQRILMDYIFLHRDNSVVRPFFEWQESGGVLADMARESDRPAILAMVARYEGEASARLAAHWLDQQPGRFLVFRDPAHQPVGFVAMIALHQASPEDLETDPATRAAWRSLQDQAPLRSGEGATHFRFWMAHDTYQAVSPIQSLIFVNMVRHYRTTPGLAFTFLPCADANFWLPMFSYADLARLPAADFVVGDRGYGVYGHDWRVVPPTAWLDLLAEREIAAAPRTTARQTPPEPIVVLSQPAFAAAVRDALRTLSRLEAPRANPLLQSRMVLDRAGVDSTLAGRAAALQSLLREACASLATAPKEAKFFRALDHTYLRPATSQEQAAELLDVPFSTFRRHLKAGIERVVAVLWQREIGG